MNHKELYNWLLTNKELLQLNTFEINDKGWNGGIISYTINIFTVAFIVEIEGIKFCEYIEKANSDFYSIFIFNLDTKEVYQLTPENEKPLSDISESPFKEFLEFTENINLHNDLKIQLKTNLGAKRKINKI